MKKIIAITMAALALTGCAAKSRNKNGNSGEARSSVQAVNPDFDKIDRVIEKMSPRFQQEIKIENKQEFLHDLNIVLNEEKKYNPDDVNLYYLIDKKHNIGSEYVPQGLISLKKNDLYNISRNDLSLRPEAEAGLKELAQAALNDGERLLVSSTYRSYDYQTKLFEKWVRIDGLAEAERESARAGTSQHQLGTAIDFGNIDDSFIETSQGKWLDENAWKYGWSLSFPHNYEDITGYRWECWHYRYIGIPACQMQKKWFGDVQQYMIEFIDQWKNYTTM